MQAEPGMIVNEGHGTGTVRYRTAYPRPLPARLPSGAAWPAISVLSVDTGEHDVAASQRSVVEQGYPAVRHVVERGDGGDTAAAWRRALALADGAFILRLDAGDRLAPGALGSMALAAVMHGADVVAGLRVRAGGDGGHVVDVIDGDPGPLDVLMLRSDLLVRRTSLDAGRATALAVAARPVVFAGAAAGDEPDEMPKLSVVSLTEPGSGGAAIAHRRLSEALRFGGHRVTPMVLTPVFAPATAEWTDRFPETEAAVLAGGFDLVFVGNIHIATRRADALARLHARVPVAVVTHDLFMLTGRCDGPIDCPLVFDRCTAACPTPTEYPYLAPDKIEAAWQGKRDFLTMDPPPLVLANSAWIEEFARKVLGPEIGKAIHPVGYAFPSQVFRPGDRRALRDKLGLPQDDVLIVFAAVVSDMPRKGMADVLATLRTLARPGIGFVMIGRIDDPAAMQLPNLFAPGPIAQEATLAEWFAACDLHITASRLESFGQTPVEAGLCGTPTVAYRRTGLTTAVIDGVSGRLADEGLEAFAAVVRDLVEDTAAREALGVVGRLALEARNSYAGSYLSLLAALRAHGLLPPARPGGRVRFDPAVLRTFDMSDDPLPGASGMVGGRPSRGRATLRRAKHAIWGRTMPLWMRRAAYVAQRARGVAQRARGLVR